MEVEMTACTYWVLIHDPISTGGWSWEQRSFGLVSEAPQLTSFEFTEVMHPTGQPR